MVRRKIRQLAKLLFLEKDIPYETNPAKIEVKLEANHQIRVFKSQGRGYLPVADIDIGDSSSLLGFLIPHGHHQD